MHSPMPIFSSDLPERSERSLSTDLRTVGSTTSATEKLNSQPDFWHRGFNGKIKFSA